MSTTFNHLGQCVSDLAQSKRFYIEVFDFEVEREISPPDDLSAPLLRLSPPLGMTACYLRRDGLVLELLHFSETGTTPADKRVMNEPGLTHISVCVDDVDATLVRVAERGGEVLHDTNIGAAVFVRDPDGQLLEILPMAYRDSLA